MSFRKTLGEWFQIAAKTFCAVVIAMALIFSVWAIGPTLEQTYFPVVSKLRMVKLTADRNGNAIVTAEFTKIRDCDYLGIAWYRGTPAAGFERVPVILHRVPGDRSSPTRAIGTQRTGPWSIGMPWGEIETNSFAELFHTCHPFWTSKTAFWP